MVLVSSRIAAAPAWSNNKLACVEPAELTTTAPPPVLGSLTYSLPAPGLNDTPPTVVEIYGV